MKYNSTISLHNEISMSQAFLCKEHGVCEEGSQVLDLSYNDAGYCDYETGCPRFYALSSSLYSQYRITATFSGHYVLKHAAELKGTYQRPALRYKFSIMISMIM